MSKPICIQFTDKEKDRIFHMIRGNVYPDFEGSEFNSPPVLRFHVSEEDRRYLVAHIGDWILDYGDHYEVTKEKPDDI